MDNHKNTYANAMPLQKRLIDIAFVIQFYLTALGHFVVWCYMFWQLHTTPPVDGPDEGRFILAIFVYQGIPISFGVLIGVYIAFRCLLAYAKIDTALTTMMSLNLLHGIVMCFTVITPIRLIIPTLLYFAAWERGGIKSIEPPELEPQEPEPQEPEPPKPSNDGELKFKKWTTYF